MREWLEKEFSLKLSMTNSSLSIYTLFNEINDFVFQVVAKRGIPVHDNNVYIPQVARNTTGIHSLAKEANCPANYRCLPNSWSTVGPDSGKVLISSVIPHYLIIYDIGFVIASLCDRRYKLRWY